MAHRRVGSNTSAKQRSGSGEIQVRGDTQDEALVNHDAFGIAAIGNTPEMLVRHIEGEGQVGAEILKSGPALRTRAVGIHQAANRGKVTGLEFGNGGTDLGDTADDLMSRNNGVDRRHEFAPLVSNRVEVGVADATEKDFDLHVVLGRSAPCDRSSG